MIRYTTPTVQIVIDNMDMSAFSEIVVTFSQLGVEVDKTPIVDGYNLFVELSQEETAGFNDKLPIGWCVNAWTTERKRFASVPQTFMMDDNLLRRVIA